MTTNTTQAETTDPIDEALEKAFQYGVGTTSEDIIGNDTAYLNLKKHAIKTGKAAINTEIARQVAEARIEELEGLLKTTYMHIFGEKTVEVALVEKRLAQLKGKT